MDLLIFRLIKVSSAKSSSLSDYQQHACTKHKLEAKPETMPEKGAITMNYLPNPHFSHHFIPRCFGPATSSSLRRPVANHPGVAVGIRCSSVATPEKMPKIVGHLEKYGGNIIFSLPSWKHVCIFLRGCYTSFNMRPVV